MCYTLRLVAHCLLPVLLLGIWASPSMGQMEYRAQLTAKKVGTWKNASANALPLPMPFAKARWLEKVDQDSIADLLLLKVELVYTRYQESDAFSQSQLNRQRLRAFQKTLPTQWANPLVEWAMVEQTGATDKATAQGLFHGFVLHFRAPHSAASTTSELAFLRAFRDDLLKYSSETPPDLSVVGGTRMYNDTNISGIKQRWDDRVGYVYDTVYTVRKMAYKPQVKRTAADSGLYVALSEAVTWKNNAVVCDVTGSMSRYTAQMLEWVRYTGKQAKVDYYLFFNDGNNKPTVRKKLGSTGGLYGTKVTDFNTIFETIAKAMKRGNGGDGPENDMEALLEAQTVCTSCQHLILIADNDAPVRDLELLPQLRLPVHVFACGNRKGINPEYLDIVRKTGGSLHAGNEIIENLHELTNGDEIKVGDWRFQVVAGHFQRQY